MIKTFKTKVETKQTNLKYPLYLYWQGEMAIDNYYSKITEDKRIDVSFEYILGTKIEIKPHCKEKGIEEHWLNHKCSEEVWNEMLKDLDDLRGL